MRVNSISFPPRTSTTRWPVAVAAACLAWGVVLAHGETDLPITKTPEQLSDAPESPGVDGEAEAKSYWMSFDGTFNTAWLNPRNVTVELVDAELPYLLYAAQDEGMGPRLTLGWNPLAFKSFLFLH